MDNRDIRCFGHVEDLDRRLSAHRSRGNGRKGGQRACGQGRRRKHRRKRGRGEEERRNVPSAGQAPPNRDPDTRGSLSTLPCVATLADWPSYVCVQERVQSFSRPTRGEGRRRVRKRRQRTGVEGKGKSTRARVPTSRITHPAPKFSISNRRGDQPRALGTGQALAGPPPSTHHHAGLRRRRRGAGSGFPAGCLLHVMGLSTLPYRTVPRLLLLRFRVASNSNPGSPPQVYHTLEPRSPLRTAARSYLSFD